MEYSGFDLMRSAKEYSLQKNLRVSDVVDAIKNVVREYEIKHYKHNKIDVELDVNGQIKVFCYLRITENKQLDESFDEDGYQLISFERAGDIYDIKDAVAGDLIKSPMPDFSLIRFDTGLARRDLFKALNDLSRAKQYESFINRIGEVMTFSILRIENGNLILISNNNETILYKNKLIKGEIYRKNEQIKVYIEDVVRADRGPQIIVSRIHKNFVTALFKQEVPEIYEGVVEIKAVARFAGVRSKIAVYSSDRSIDAVSACIGMRGMRINLIIDELRGEKIDVVCYSADISKFIGNILDNRNSRNIEQVNFNKDAGTIDVLVPLEKIPIIIGSRGQNIILASELIGYKINVLNAEENSKKRVETFHRQIDELMTALDIERVMAQLLILKGYTTVDLLLQSSAANLATIEGFDMEIAEELLARSAEFNAQFNKNDLSKLTKLNDRIIVILKDNKILKIDDLADLSRDELKEILIDIQDEEIDNIIIEARIALGWI